jgi:hypothetical protein
MKKIVDERMRLAEENKRKLLEPTEENERSASKRLINLETAIIE